MEEGEIDLMLHHFEEAAKSRLYWNYSFLMEQVANKARETRPQDSIKLYLQFGENLINQRGRSNYVQAAAYLLKIRDIYIQIGEPLRWHNMI